MTRKGRGNEPELYGNVALPTNQQVPVRQTATDIVKVISFGNGWIDVLMNNGEKYRRQGGTISWRYCNPGNIKFGAFAQSNEAIAAGWGNHSVFPNNEIGRKAKYNLLFTPVRGYNTLTILQAMNKYAPSSDKGKGVPKGGNRPNKYATFIANNIKVSTSTKLNQLSETKRQEMLAVMERYEGFKQGTVRKI